MAGGDHWEPGSEQSVQASKSTSEGEFTMRLISRADLKNRMDKWQDLKLVFALGEWQYRCLHIPGSLCLPCSPDLYRSEEALKGLQPDDEIVVYCSNDVCYASISLYHLLVDRGYHNVSRYAGGLLDWDDAGYPLEGEMAVVSSGSTSS
jgi:rhodanese-related sulfurtransferase